jgi:hypothetical protein
MRKKVSPTADEKCSYESLSKSERNEQSKEEEKREKKVKEKNSKVQRCTTVCAARVSDLRSG